MFQGNLARLRFISLVPFAEDLWKKFMAHESQSNHAVIETSQGSREAERAESKFGGLTLCVLWNKK
jgi:hypothetical protein